MSLVLLASLFGPMPTALASPVPTSSPRDLSAAGENGDNAQVAVDPAGNAVVVWLGSDGAHDRVQVRRRSASGSLSAVQTLSAAGQDATDPQVALDALGNAVVVWTRSDGNHDRIQVRRRSVSGSLSAVQTLSAVGGDAFGPQVAVGANGNAVVVWERYNGTDNRIQVRRRAAGGSLTAVQNLSPSGQHAYEPQVAVDANGNAVVVWYRFDGAHDRIQVRRRTAAGGLSAVQTLSPAGQNASNPQVAVDPDGNAVAAWRRFDGTKWRIQVRRRAAGGSLSAVQTLSDAGQDASDPQVAVDRNGNAVVAWYRFDGANFRIQAVRRTAGGSLSAVLTLSGAGQGAIRPRVAIDREGNAMVVWQTFDGADFRIQGLRRTAGGSLSEVLTLSAAGQDAANAELGVDPEGNSVVVWSRYDGTHNRVQASYLLEVKTLSAAGKDANASQVALDRGGNAVVAWRAYDGANYRIQVRRRTASGGLSAVQTLSPAGRNAYEVQLAVDPSGNAVVVWQVFDGVNYRIQARRRTAAGSLSSVRTLSQSGQDAEAPQVAVDGDGNAVVVWSRSDGTEERIQARRRTAGGSLSAVQTLSHAGRQAFRPQVGMDRAGNAVVVWQRSDGANWRVQLRRRTAAGGLSAVQTLTPSGETAYEPRLAVDRDGAAVVVWERYNGIDNRIQVRRRTAAGGLSTVKNLSAAGQNAFNAQVAVDPNGNAVVVWDWYDGTHFRIQARRRTAAGGLSTVKNLSAAGQHASNAQVALDAKGNAVVVWTRFDGAKYRIQTRRRSASGSLGPVQTVSAAGQDAQYPQVAADAAGNGVVVWQRYDGSDDRIQAARLRTG
jgi:microcompartment protein CcmK/EutM